jgi:hypothetical protein
MRPFLPVLPATCGYVGILAAFTAMLPAVVCGAAAGGLASEAAQDPTKYFLTCLHLLVQVGMALKDLVLSHKTLATTRGLANRVGGLLDALDSSVKAAPSQAPKPPPNAMATTDTQSYIIICVSVPDCRIDDSTLVPGFSVPSIVPRSLPRNYARNLVPSHPPRN